MRFLTLIKTAIAAAILVAAPGEKAAAQSDSNILRVARGVTSSDISVSVNRAIVLESAQRFAEVSVANPDIADDTVLESICTQVGLDPQAFFAAINDSHYKDLLRSNTDEVIARGAYGSPTLYINDDDMYFGNDRLPLVEYRLQALLSG